MCGTCLLSVCPTTGQESHLCNTSLGPLHFPLGDLPGSELRGSRGRFTIHPWERSATPDFPSSVRSTSSPRRTVEARGSSRSAHLPQSHWGPRHVQASISSWSSPPGSMLKHTHKSLDGSQSLVQCLALAWHSRPPIINPQSSSSSLVCNTTGGESLNSGSDRKDGWSSTLCQVGPHAPWGPDSSCLSHQRYFTDTPCRGDHWAEGCTSALGVFFTLYVIWRTSL